MLRSCISLKLHLLRAGAAPCRLSCSMQCRHPTRTAVPLESQLLGVRCTWESSGTRPRCLVPCIHMANLQDIPDCWALGWWTSGWKTPHPVSFSAPPHVCIIAFQINKIDLAFKNYRKLVEFTYFHDTDVEAQVLPASPPHLPLLFLFFFFLQMFVSAYSFTSQ